MDGWYGWIEVVGRYGVMMRCWGGVGGGMMRWLVFRLERRRRCRFGWKFSGDDEQVHNSHMMSSCSAFVDHEKWLVPNDAGLYQMEAYRYVLFYKRVSARSYLASAFNFSILSAMVFATLGPSKT